MSERSKLRTRDEIFFLPDSANNILQDLREGLDVPTHQTHLIISPSFLGHRESFPSTGSAGTCRAWGFASCLEQTHP